MERDEILQKLTEILVKMFHVKQERVTEASNLIDDLGAASLDHLTLLVDLEETFNIHISDAEAEKCLTVGSIVDLIEGKI